jgi:phytoene/squalene synthetase
MLSAAPVGELVLRIFEVSSPDRIALSDDVCNGLQIVEHIQDVAEDIAADRVYLPQSDLRALGCTEAELRAPRTSPALRAVLRYEAGRARRLLSSAVPLARQLPFQPRIAVCGFAAGGLAALDAIEGAGYEVLARRAGPGRSAWPCTLGRAGWPPRSRRAR